jgi:hypothetical protein
LAVIYYSQIVSLTNQKHILGGGVKAPTWCHGFLHPQQLLFGLPVMTVLFKFETLKRLFSFEFIKSLSVSH